MANRKPLVINSGVKRILGSADYLWAPGGLTVGDNSELTFLADVGFAAIVSSEVDTPLDFSIDGGIRFSFGPNGELLVGGTAAGTAGQILSSGGSGAPVIWTSLKTVNSTSLIGSGNVAVQATLVSGTNIKTVNSTSLLGSGNLAVGDVTGPASATANSVPVYSGTTGKLLTTSKLKYISNVAVEEMSLETAEAKLSIVTAKANFGSVYSYGTINGAAEDTGSAAMEIFTTNGTTNNYIFGYVDQSSQYFDWSANLPLDFKVESNIRFSIGTAGQFGIGPSRTYGTSGQAFISGGPSAQPSWSSLKTINGESILGSGNITVSGGGGSGDVVGPSSSTVRSVSIFADTTGKLLEEATGLYHDDNGLPTEFSSLYLGSADFSQTATVDLSTSGVFGAGLDVYTEDLDTGALSNFRVDSKAKSKITEMTLSVESDNFLLASFALDDNFLRMRMGIFDTSFNETTLDIDLEDAAIWSIAINEVVASSERNAVIWGTDSFTSFDIRFEVNTSDSGSTFSFGRDGTLLVSGAAGTAGQVLTSAGPGAPITWTTVSGGDQITVSATPPVSPTLNQLWLDIS